MMNESQAFILEYLQKSDLNIEKAANLYLNQDDNDHNHNKPILKPFKIQSPINNRIIHKYSRNNQHKIQSPNVIQNYFKPKNINIDNKENNMINSNINDNTDPVPILMNLHKLSPKEPMITISPSTIIDDHEDEENTSNSSLSPILSQINAKQESNLLIDSKTISKSPLSPNSNNKNIKNEDSSISDIESPYFLRSSSKSNDSSTSSPSDIQQSFKQRNKIKRKRKRNKYETTDSRRRSPRILKMRGLCQNDTESDFNYDGSEEFDEESVSLSPINKKRKIDHNIESIRKYDESEALSMIMNILKDKPLGMKRYQLLAKLQKDNNDIKWSESFAIKVGEFNVFVKKHEKLSIFNESERNFGIMTFQRAEEMLKYKHQLYESDDDTNYCSCHI